MIISPTSKPIILPPSHPNAGLESAYQRKLKQMVTEMHKSLLYHLIAAYRAREDEITQDASPAVFLQGVLKKLGNKWLKHFNDAASILADFYTRKTMSLADVSLKSQLKGEGFAVEFKMTDGMNNTMRASIAEQVGLIKSIPQQYHTQVEGLVMRSVSSGRDLKTLSDELQKRYDITKKRASLIAVDQVNKSFAMIDRQRTLDMGIREAMWLHSHGGRNPRPSHLAFDRHIYEIEKGAYLDGKFVWPGTEINCECAKKSIIPKG